MSKKRVYVLTESEAAMVVKALRVHVSEFETRVGEMNVEGRLADRIETEAESPDEWMARLTFLRDNFGVALPLDYAEKTINETDALIATAIPGWPKVRS